MKGALNFRGLSVLICEDNFEDIKFSLTCPLYSFLPPKMRSRKQMTVYRHYNKEVSDLWTLNHKAISPIISQVLLCGSLKQNILFPQLPEKAVSFFYNCSNSRTLSGLLKWVAWICLFFIACLWHIKEFQLWFTYEEQESLWVLFKPSRQWLWLMIENLGMTELILGLMLFSSLWYFQ